MASARDPVVPVVHHFAAFAREVESSAELPVFVDKAAENVARIRLFDD